MPYCLRDGNAVLLQISGGGRVLVGDGTRQWWEKPTKREWRVSGECSHKGDKWDTRERAEEIAVALRVYR